MHVIFYEKLNTENNMVLPSSKDDKTSITNCIVGKTFTFIFSFNDIQSLHKLVIDFNDKKFWHKLCICTFVLDSEQFYAVIVINIKHYSGSQGQK